MARIVETDMKVVFAFHTATQEIRQPSVPPKPLKPPVPFTRENVHKNMERNLK